MPALNRVQLIGHLGKDPEGKVTPSGKKVSNFSIAVTQRRKIGGEAREFTEWVNIEVWGKLSQLCQEYLKKGSLVYVEGRLQTDKYEHNGETKYYTKVVASTLQFLDKKPAEEPMIAIDEEQSEYEA